MDSMKTYVLIWLSGVIAGLVMVERWRRVGARSRPEPAITEIADEAAPSVPAEQPKLAGLIVAGAKADARHVRRLVDQVLPWGTPADPSVARLRAGVPQLPQAAPPA